MFARFKTLVAAALVLVVGGCAIPPTNMEGYRTVDEVAGLPLLRLALFADTKPQRVQYADIMIREEYARYDAHGARAELFYVNPRHENQEYVALNHRYDSSNVATLFNYLNGRKVISPKGTGVETDLADVWYRILTLPDDDKQCVVFNAEWDLHGEDALLRPDKVLFGYYCAPAGAALDKAAALEVIDALGVRGNNVRFTGDSLAIGAPAQPAVEKKLMALARGDGAGGAWGAAEFPFDMAAPYAPSGADPWD